MGSRKTFPFFLASASSQSFTGILNVSWGGMFKSFIIKKGKICDLLSNRAEESIEEFVKRKYKIPQELLEKAAREKKLPVEFLVERGIITLSELREGNKARMVEALKDLFSWKEPEFSFQEWEVECELPPVDVSLALKEAIFSTRDRMFFKRLFPMGARLITSGFPQKPTPQERRILKDFSQGKDVWEVVRSSPLGEFPALKTIAYLYIFGFLKPYVEEHLEEIEEVKDTGKFQEEGSSFNIRLIVIALILVILAGAGLFAYLKISAKPHQKKNTRVSSLTREKKRSDLISHKKKSLPESKIRESKSPVVSSKEELQSPPTEPWKLVKQGALLEAARMWRAWARKQKGYTLLVQLNCVKEYALKGLIKGGSKYFVVPFNYRGKTCYRLCYGVFPSREEALKYGKKGWVPHPLSRL